MPKSLKPDPPDDYINSLSIQRNELQSKVAKQRNEIARLTQALEDVTKESIARRKEIERLAVELEVALFVPEDWREYMSLKEQGIWMKGFRCCRERVNAVRFKEPHT